ncbi:MAG: hypothetical protein CMH60_03165 [Myxococcales bacterium]|nr:hypothetical protein [Myxococcales bacterium]
MYPVVKACFTLFACLFAVHGCTTGSGSEAVPTGEFHYPLDTAYHSASGSLYVLNTNFDGRYKSGWVSSIDLGGLIERANNGDVTLAEVYQNGQAVQAFGGALLVDGTSNVLYASHRGTDSISVLQVDSISGALSCRVDGLSDKVCDDDHRYEFSTADFSEDKPSRLSDPLALSITTNPADTQKRILLVGHAGTGRLSVLNMEEGENPPRLSAHRSLYLGGDGNSALALHPDQSQGLFASLGTQLNSSDGIRGRIYHVDLQKALGESEDDYIFSDSAHSEVYSRELNAIAFSSNGDFAYMLANAPDALLVFNSAVSTESYISSSTGELANAAWPHFELVDAHSFSGFVSDLVYWSTDAGDKLAVSNFEEGSVSFFDVGGGSAALAGKLNNLGQGLLGLELITIDEKNYLIALGFNGNSLSVIELDGSSAADYRLLAKVGTE